MAMHRKRILTISSIFLFVVLYDFQPVSAEKSVIKCMKREREALLRFKQGLVDKDGRLSSWGSDDECCEWEGVRCRNTGQVTDLNMEGYQLQGIIYEAHFKELHNLVWLSLSFNALTLRLGSNWVPPFNLQVIDLARCKMGPSFPTWLHTQTEFNYLDISDNGISNEAPKWLWNLSTSYVKYFDISDNQISGTIPDFLTSNENYISILDVSSNKFSGPLPLFHLSTIELRFSQNTFSGSISYVCTSQRKIELLDLSNNLFFGEIPDFWGNMTNLIILNLSNNSFFGKIPHSFGSLSNLATLHLRDNDLSGELPSTLKNCQSLQLIDVAVNELTGHIPSWIGGSNYTNMVLLNLRQNMFYGGIPSEICSLTQIQILDLAGNNMSGEIPQCFNNFTSFVDKNYLSIENMMFGRRVLDNYDIYGSFHRNSPVSPPPPFIESYIDYALVQWKGQAAEYRKGLVFLKLIDLSSNSLVGSIPASFSSLRGLISLNLSSNSLIGNIIPNIGQMEELEVLDLSKNQLSGEIPKGIAHLNFLAVVDLARNNLSGEIPPSTQLQRQDASAYYENNGLCGPPLPPCYVNTSTNNQEQYMKNKDGLLEFWIPLVFGGIIGFWGFVGSLVLKRSWRYAYFTVLDVVGGWLYVNVVIFLSKMRRG